MASVEVKPPSKRNIKASPKSSRKSPKSSRKSPTLKSSITSRRAQKLNFSNHNSHKQNHILGMLQRNQEKQKEIEVDSKEIRRFVKALKAVAPIDGMDGWSFNKLFCQKSGYSYDDLILLPGKWNEWDILIVQWSSGRCCFVYVCVGGVV